MRRAHEALNGGDIDAVVALCDPELRLVRDVWDRYTWEPEELIERGDLVVALLRSTATGRESGIELEWRTAIVWRVRQGRAMSLRFFRDREAALDAAAPGETR